MKLDIILLFNKQVVISIIYILVSCVVCVGAYNFVNLLFDTTLRILHIFFSKSNINLNILKMLSLTLINIIYKPKHINIDNFNKKIVIILKYYSIFHIIEIV